MCISLNPAESCAKQTRKLRGSGYICSSFVQIVEAVAHTVRALFAHFSHHTNKDREPHCLLRTSATAKVTQTSRMILDWCRNVSWFLEKLRAASTNCESSVSNWTKREKASSWQWPSTIVCKLQKKKKKTSSSVVANGVSTDM